MTNNELFINATRANYQFPFRGMINVIDLWDLSLTNLDSVFKTLNAEVKKSEEESLLNTKSKEDEEISNKIEIVKYIVSVKLDEKKKREDAKKNAEMRQRLLEIKADNKDRLIKYVEEHNGVTIDRNSIVDSQIKRLHAYKRQLLNVLRIIHLYKRMKADPSFRITPHTYIFAAKAAPSYSLAKNIIELINVMGEKINNDPEISKYMKVVFIENYGVSNAEIIIPASDVSEQISTAGKEASGTGNMKFMMNGAITMGTLDGANVEISRLIGMDNCVIFGKHADELDKIRYEGSYRPWDIYNSDPCVKEVVDSLIDGTWDNNHDRFRQIYDDLMYRGDEFFVLLDFVDYLRASKKIDELYSDRLGWAKMCLINIANSGWFSSDRTIAEYNNEVWHLPVIKPVK